MLGPLAIATLFLGVQAQSIVESEIVLKGYRAQSHNVTTDDGYILQLHRMYRNTTNGPVVFLMHGVALASSSFIFAGPENAMGYNFADAGFDVWMGNARGNNYSHAHTVLTAEYDPLQFFDFSYEEIGLRDLPAMIDYVLATTQRDQLHYVGHSLGGTVFYVLNSMNTTYQSKFASAHLLAGLGYQTNFPNTKIRFLSHATDLIYGALLSTNEVEMKPVRFTATFLRIFMNDSVPVELDGGASVKEVTHYCQNIRDKSFARWNFHSTNLQKYGASSAPIYDLTKINVKVTLYYSVGDATQSETDALAMAKDLPNATARKVARDSFTNLDYLLSDDAKTLVTASIINAIKNA